MNPVQYEGDDPLSLHFRRSPLPGAGVRIVAIAGKDASKTREIADGIASLFAERGREAEVVVVEPFDGRSQAVTCGIEGAVFPLVLVTTAETAWTAAHLDPLLAAIDKADHVIGRRRISLFRKGIRRLSALRWKLIFAVPVIDVHSPCRIHRREKIAEIAFQSTSSFLDIETLAKATFLGHLLDEVPVPYLESHETGSMFDDFREVFRKPNFPRPVPEESSPAEELQGQREGDRGPGEEDQQGNPDDALADRGPVQNDSTEPRQEVGKGESLREPMGRPLGEAIGGEEQAREDPHRQHDEVHEP